MRILVDAFWWFDGPTSGRNVLRSLVCSWVRQFPNDELTLRVPEGKQPAVENEVHRLGQSVTVDQYPSWIPYHAVAVGTICARRRRFDAVLSQNFCPPLATSQRVVLVHDAVFATNPEWFTRRELLYLAGIRPSLRRATTVLATSRSEARRIRSVWPELADRVVEVGLSVPVDLTEATAQMPSGWKPQTPFILAVGRLNIRKNLQLLVDAFAEFALTNGQHHLVIVGEPDGLYSPGTVPATASQRVHFVRGVGDSQLRWLYEHCDLFVFPSLGEGYGLPIVEAHSMGARVIASDIPVARELDVAVDYFDPRSKEQVIAALKRGLADSERPRAPKAFRSWQEVVIDIRRLIEER